MDKVQQGRALRNMLFWRVTMLPKVSKTLSDTDISIRCTNSAVRHLFELHNPCSCWSTDIHRILHSEKQRHILRVSFFLFFFTRQVRYTSLTVCSAAVHVPPRGASRPVLSLCELLCATSHTRNTLLEEIVVSSRLRTGNQQANKQTCRCAGKVANPITYSRSYRFGGGLPCG